MAARHRSAFGFLAVAVGLVAASFTLTAQGRAPVSNAGSARQDSVLARTPDGHPDFQGVWANNTVTPLQRPKQWEGKTLLTDAEIAELQNFAAQIVENDGDAQFGDGLITAVLNHVANPKSYDPGTGNYNQFWLVERDWHDRRTSLITDPPDGRIPPLTPEGQTLVIDTTNFSPKSDFMGSHENLHLTERLTRVGPEVLNYEFTVSDPTMWTAAWTAMIPLKLKDELIYEYACHEGNDAMSDMLRGHRFEEREGAAKTSSK